MNILAEIQYQARVLSTSAKASSECEKTLRELRVKLIEEINLTKYDWKIYELAYCDLASYNGDRVFDLKPDSGFSIRSSQSIWENIKEPPPHFLCKIGEINASTDSEGCLFLRSYLDKMMPFIKERGLKVDWTCVRNYYERMSNQLATFRSYFPTFCSYFPLLKEPRSIVLMNPMPVEQVEFSPDNREILVKIVQPSYYWKDLPDEERWTIRIDDHVLSPQQISLTMLPPINEQYSYQCFSIRPLSNEVSSQWRYTPSTFIGAVKIICEKKKEFDGGQKRISCWFANDLS